MAVARSARTRCELWVESHTVRSPVASGFARTPRGSIASATSRGLAMCMCTICSASVWAFFLPL
jgi:hypothetical protein